MSIQDSKFCNDNIYKAYEKLTPFYDNTLEQAKSGHQFFKLFSYIANYFWTPVHILVSESWVS